MRPRLTYANVVATLALIIAVGGASAFAATQLAKNSVGSKQLKKNAVTTAKVKNEAITAAKVKKGTLTGKQVDASTLGTVPAANKATVAGTAESLTAGEPWHDVGTPGEPGFQNSWQTSGSVFTPPVGFYKDHEGIVHLRGFANGGSQKEIFQLPAGFQPLKAKLVEVPVVCGGAGCPNSIGALTINGGGFGAASGAVFAPENAALVGLEGISFRAES